MTSARRKLTVPCNPIRSFGGRCDAVRAACGKTEAVRARHVAHDGHLTIDLKGEEDSRPPDPDTRSHGVSLFQPTPAVSAADIAADSSSSLGAVFFLEGFNLHHGGTRLGTRLLLALLGRRGYGGVRFLIAFGDLPF